MGATARQTIRGLISGACLLMLGALGAPAWATPEPGESPDVMIRAKLGAGGDLTGRLSRTATGPAGAERLARVIASLTSDPSPLGPALQPVEVTRQATDSAVIRFGDRVVMVVTPADARAAQAKSAPSLARLWAQRLTEALTAAAIEPVDSGRLAAR